MKIEIGLDSVKVKDTSGKYVYIYLDDIDTIISMIELENKIRLSSTYLQKINENQ